MTTARSIIASLILLWGSTAFAQDAKLIEAAKKEGGKAVVYGSLDSDTGDAIGNAFFKKTGIKDGLLASLVDQGHGPSGERVSRRETAFRRAHQQCHAHADTFEGRHVDQVRFAFGQGFFEGCYRSEPRAQIPQRRHRHHLQQRSNQAVGRAKVFGRSRQAAVSGAKSLWPIPSNTRRRPNGSPAFTKLWEKTRRTSSFAIWEQTKPALVESYIPAAERVITAETPIAIAFVRYVYLYGQKGAPLDYVQVGQNVGRRASCGAGQQGAQSERGQRPLSISFSTTRA